MKPGAAPILSKLTSPRSEDDMCSFHCKKLHFKCLFLPYLCGKFIFDTYVSPCFLVGEIQNISVKINTAADEGESLRQMKNGLTDMSASEYSQA